MKDIYGFQVEEKDQVFTSVTDINGVVLCEVIKVMPNTMKLRVVGVFSPSEQWLLGHVLTRKPTQVVRQTEFIDNSVKMYVKED